MFLVFSCCYCVIMTSFIFLQSAVVMEREEKVRNAKLKPKKRKLKTESKQTHEYFCYCCGEGGELVMCDRKDCPKAYHLLCLNLTKPPSGSYAIANSSSVTFSTFIRLHLTRSTRSNCEVKFAIYSVCMVCKHAHAHPH